MVHMFYYFTSVHINESLIELKLMSFLTFISLRGTLDVYYQAEIGQFIDGII